MGKDGRREETGKGGGGRQTEREREKKEERLGEHLLHPSLCLKPFVLLLTRCPHGTVLLDMVGLCEGRTRQ